MASKKPSGSANRKAKDRREKTVHQLSSRLSSWLNTEKNEQFSEANSETDTEQEKSEGLPPAPQLAISEVLGPLTEILSDAVLDIAGCSSTECKKCTGVNNDQDYLNSQTSPEVSKKVIDYDQILHIDFTDPALWPEITQNIRTLLVQHGPAHSTDASFVFPSKSDGRRFDPKWYFKTLKNGEQVNRKWLMYSKTKDALFCFPCLLFEKSSKSQGFSDIANGFRDWKHLNPNVQRHENAKSHMDSFIAWKMFENHLSSGKTIDAELQEKYIKETEKWKTILKVMLDVILFCAKNNLALRGDGGQEVPGQPGCGIFLNALELVSHYHPVLADHLAHVKANKKVISYMSPQIQNEIIELVGGDVKSRILEKIHAAKYFTVMADCTPDCSHKEQMSLVIRYVDMMDGKCQVEESFIGFVITTEKTGEGLFQEISAQLSLNGLDLKNCRGQAYDNGSNMAGRKQGVQARFRALNELAVFVPCAAHNLNLVGTSVANSSPSFLTFFGTVQQIFNFFSGSTTRWDLLSSKLSITLKGHSDTRWSSKQRAVTALKSSVNLVHSCLIELTDRNQQNDSTVLGAHALLKQINFKFLCMLFVWEKILKAIDRVNQCLQSKSITIDEGCVMIEGLIETLDKMTDLASCAVAYAKDEAAKIGTDDDFPAQRGRKKKKRFDEEPEVPDVSSPEKKFRDEVDEVFKHIGSELDRRFQVMREISEKFSFLSGKTLKKGNMESITQGAIKCAQHYKTDLDQDELLSELEVYVPQINGLLPDLDVAKPIDILRCIQKYSLEDIYPNIKTALRIFATLPITVANCERSFSKLKLIKNYLRSGMGQDRLTSLAILSIEHQTVSEIDIDKIIHSFATAKVRKVKF